MLHAITTAVLLKCNELSHNHYYYWIIKFLAFCNKLVIKRENYLWICYIYIVVVINALRIFKYLALKSTLSHVNNNATYYGDNVSIMRQILWLTSIRYWMRYCFSKVSKVCTYSDTYCWWGNMCFFNYLNGFY